MVQPLTSLLLALWSGAMNNKRKSGILMHPTSLPGPYGMGEIGVDACAFIDRLADMNQTLWQVLPLGPTGYGDSPYQVHSSFACNNLLICFRGLIADGLLDEDELTDFPEFPADRVVYGDVIPARKAVLAGVAMTFEKRATPAIRSEFEAYCQKHAGWLDDYALYQALKEHFDLAPWYRWPNALRDRDSEALNQARHSFSGEIQSIRVQQYLFDRQWTALRAYAAERGIQLIGDIPIFVAHDSADVWARPDLFFMDEQGQPTVVAGVPPDYFSADGQLWGNPLYNWEVHKEDNYAWWIKRLQRSLALVDILRIDHFRGFEAYWAVPYGDETAANGQWQSGPDHHFFESILGQMGDLPIIAEDLGLITEGVDRLRDDFDLPGMRVMHFSFGENEQPRFTPAGFPENNVVYTGTHDNDTTVGWFHAKPGGQENRSLEELEALRRRVLAATGTEGREIHWELMALAFKSAPHIAIAPLQDLLGLGSEARMNIPGTTQGNWQWRMKWPQLNEEIVHKTLKITKDSQRNGVT